jgi:hypothetical protein
VEGVVAPQDGSMPRSVLIVDAEEFLSKYIKVKNQ